MSKEEMEEIIKDHKQLSEEVFTKGELDVYEAMQEHAEEQSRLKAIAFAEWISDGLYKEHSSKRGVWFYNNGDKIADTTEQLYNLFEQQNKPR